MSLTDAYPISAPAAFVDVGTVWFAHTGAVTYQNVGDVTIAPTGSLFLNPQGGVVNFSGASIYNFVTTGAGQIMYADGSNKVVPLPIGTDGQFLQLSSGVPTWQTLASQGPLVSVWSNGSPATFAASTTWTTLDSTGAAWDSTVIGGVYDTSYSTGTGVFTAPAAGVYEICASVAYQADNRGTNGLIAGARATRQLQVYRTSAPSGALMLVAKQAEASSTNPTQVDIANCKVSLAANDTVVLQARHDCPVNLGIIGSDRRSFFSVSRVR